MKAGYHGNTELQKRLERADSGVRPIVQAVVTESEDIIDTYGEWSGADAIGGFDVLNIGAIRLAGSDATHLSQATNDTGFSELNGPHNPPFGAAVVEWSGVDSTENIEIHSITARLNPDTGAGKNVSVWKCQLWRLARVGARDTETDTAWELQALTDTVSVTAGAATADVKFDFSGNDYVVTPGPPPDMRGETIPSGSEYYYATTVVQIWGVQADGSAATNTAWRADSASASKTVSGHTLTHTRFLAAQSPESYQTATVFDTDDGTACPYLIIKGRTYTSQTITFSSAGNMIDLGTTSLNTLECVARAAEFGGSRVTFQIATTSSTFHNYFDGDVIGASSPTTNLAGMAKAQKYKMRATLDPSTDGDTSPAVYEMGVRNITKTDLDGLVNIGPCRWAVDPVSLRGEIGEINLEFLRDGILDYRDAATELLSDNHLDDVEYDIWIGHPELDRRRWLYIDRFVEDDRETAGAGINLTCVSRLASLRQEVPPIANSTMSTSIKSRSPVEYSAAKASSIYTDLISNQIALADRYIGPGIESTRVYSKNLKKIRPGKNYLDEVCYLEGGSVISSQG